MDRDDATLLDMKRAIDQIEEFLDGVSQKTFFEDSKTQSAVLYQLLVIGEAVKRLSPEFRTQHNSMPWALIAGMRDHLIHAYDTVDWEEVWNTVTNDVPILSTTLEPLLPKRPDTE